MNKNIQKQERNYNSLLRAILSFVNKMLIIKNGRIKVPEIKENYLALSLSDNLFFVYYLLLQNCC